MKDKGERFMDVVAVITLTAVMIIGAVLLVS